VNKKERRGCVGRRTERQAIWGGGKGEVRLLTCSGWLEDGAAVEWLPSGVPSG
jgi:hypothetical protein